jgi:outer membrane immunogenic protein
MRKFFIAGLLAFCAFAAGGAPARAADIPLKAPPPLPCDWCGFYAGINIGADWGTSTVSPAPGVPFPAFFTAIPGVCIVCLVPAQLGQFPAVSGSGSSVIGGGQAGYNWQNGHFVYGLEGDFDGTGLRMNSASALTRVTAFGTQTVTANFSAKVDWIATLRGRLGYAVDRGMLYATGGLAIGGTQLNTTYGDVLSVTPLFPLAPLAASDSHVLAGWTLGVGGEWLFNKSWSGGLEYRHTDLGAHSFNIGLSDASLVGFFPPGSASVRFTEDQVTARLNYHFH